MRARFVVSCIDSDVGNNTSAQIVKASSLPVAYCMRRRSLMTHSDLNQTILDASRTVNLSPPQRSRYGRFHRFPFIRAVCVESVYNSVAFDRAKSGFSVKKFRSSEAIQCQSSSRQLELAAEVTMVNRKDGAVTGAPRVTAPPVFRVISQSRLNSVCSAF